MIAELIQTLDGDEIRHDEHVNVIDALEHALNESAFGIAVKPSKGSLINRNVKSFIKQNPKLALAASAFALSAYSKYKSNQRNIIRLFAKDNIERKMMKDIVDILVNTGNFKLKKTRYTNGGKSWVLQRK